MRRNLLICSLAAALAASAGCYPDAVVTAGPGYASVEPGLESVGPGVDVVDDLDYPVFYNGGFYWMYDGGSWYRSHNWRGGWIGVGPSYVPGAVRGIRAPYRYSHWHGGHANVIGYRGYHGGHHVSRPHHGTYHR